MIKDITALNAPDGYWDSMLPQKARDTLVPAPTTAWGLWERWKNNYTAQAIGMSPFSRTIEVRQVHEVSPIIVYGRKYADKFSQTIKTVEYLTDEDGLSYRVGSRDGEDD